MRKINKVAVLGSGIMGSRIACHFANAGVSVLLLDICPAELSPEETAAGLSLNDPAVRNRIVNKAFEATLKANPAALYRKSYASRIRTGNFEDHFHEIADCDWILEAVVERLDVKKSVFEKVERYRKAGALVTTNTSGIPVQLMEEGRSDDFRKHFCGTHFFNPPRYLRLLEIIPGKQTDPDVLRFLEHYGDLFLGKTTVRCKDTPAFIANRIGIFGIMYLFHLVEKLGLTVEEVDKLSGPVLGRPKSATFRTCDVVGLDTLVHVANGLSAGLKDDSLKDYFKLPAYVSRMVENKWLGDKTKQGFYKKVKGEDGKSEILALDLGSLEYRPQKKSRFATLEQTKNIDDLALRMPVLLAGKDQAGAFYRATFSGLFRYVSERIPEIADEVYRIDAAMEAGFGWEKGPFESWDLLGVEGFCQVMEKEGMKAAPWVYEMLAAGCPAFYKTENGKKYYYDIPSKSYRLIPGQDAYVILPTIRSSKTVWSNSGCNIIDLGDDVLCCEFKTKMNTIGGEVVQGVNKAIDLAEAGFRGLVIGNEGANFSAGANLAMVFMMAIEQEWDEIDMAIRMFQRMNMRVRYSSIPVVVAPFGLSLGGGCEMTLHADKVQAHAELYTGMVEFGVGLIPGGGGTKEFALRLSDSFRDGDIEINALRERFLTIGQAKVSTSAAEAYDLGILRPGLDEVSLNKTRLLADAKKAVLELSEAGYTAPQVRKDIRVLGKSGLGIVWVGANSMLSGHYISEHDQLISQKLGYILCGGDLSAPTLVSEQYLLDLEREAFLSLCGEKKTLERIQSILNTGKALRN
ncbi:MAG: 3-hydroxyacyl-CoA dehydrogenase/enoyl-CoA hydratase family protein [Bacteroidia bacterium]|nr:3-hydroxyacyl-CoA dehydrogenase/enoyl-CoA hydratase family protein [Bacteroidia bacterium]